MFQQVMDPLVQVRQEAQRWQDELARVDGEIGEHDRQLAHIGAQLSALCSAAEAQPLLDQRARVEVQRSEALARRAMLARRAEAAANDLARQPLLQRATALSAENQEAAQQWLALLDEYCGALAHATEVAVKLVAVRRTIERQAGEADNLQRQGAPANVDRRALQQPLDRELALVGWGLSREALVAIAKAQA